jgi:ribose transport system permease protein
MTKAGINPYAAFIIGVSAGLLFGLINGFIVTRLKLNSMVTTIGMQGVYGGITLVITKGQAVTQIPDSIFFIGKGNIGMFPIPFIIVLVMMIISFIFASKSKTGRYLYAIGNSKTAARILGIKVDNIRMLTFGIMGFLSALAGMLSVARLGSAQAAVGTTWAMNSIAACVIGGVLLTGGVGNPMGALIGAAIISIISNIIVLVGVNIYWQSAVSGIVVVFAIALPSILNIIRENRKGKKIAQSKTS